MSSQLRICLVLAVLTGVASALVTPAMAVNQSVYATKSNTWSPSTVTVNTGESVHFSNSNDGTHDLRFNGESKAVTPLSASWTYDRTFPSTGTFAFYCTIHANMTGSVVVKQATTTSPTTTTTTSPTGTTTTSPTATTTEDTTPTGSATSPPPPPANGAAFATSPKSLRVSKTGRLKYTFVATPLRSGKLSLKSTKKIKIGSTIRFVKLAAKAYTASAAGHVKVTFKLSSAQLQALKRVKHLRLTVTATLGAKTFQTKLTLKAPTTT